MTVDTLDLIAAMLGWNAYLSMAALTGSQFTATWYRWNVQAFSNLIVIIIENISDLTVIITNQVIFKKNYSLSGVRLFLNTGLKDFQKSLFS